MAGSGWNWGAAIGASSVTGVSIVWAERGVIVKRMSVARATDTGIDNDICTVPASSWWVDDDGRVGVRGTIKHNVSSNPNRRTNHDCYHVDDAPIEKCFEKTNGNCPALCAMDEP